MGGLLFRFIDLQYWDCKGVAIYEKRSIKMVAWTKLNKISSSAVLVSRSSVPILFVNDDMGFKFLGHRFRNGVSDAFRKNMFIG